MQGNGIVSTPEHYINTADKGLRLIKASKIAIRDDNGDAQYLLTVLDDITERRRSEQHISYLAHNDSLTGLPNRTSFLKHLFDTLDDAAKNGSRFAIMCLDLDRFKEANDTYGHLSATDCCGRPPGVCRPPLKAHSSPELAATSFIVVLSCANPR